MVWNNRVNEKETVICKAVFSFSIRYNTQAMLSLSSKSSRSIKTSLGFLLFVGVVLLVLYFRQPSETGNQLIFGMSAARLSFGGFFAILISFIVYMVFLSFKRPDSIMEYLNRVINSKNRLFASLTTVYGFALLTGGVLLLTLFPAAQGAELILGVILRLGYLILWLFAASIVLGFLFVSLYKETHNLDGILPPLKLVLCFWMFLCVYILLVAYYRMVAFAVFLNGFEFPLLWLGLYYLVWGWVSETRLKIPNKESLNRFLLLAGIFLTVFVLYGHLADWVDWVHKNRFEYWDSLALQFVSGKLYLADGSITNFTTHDLTLHNGKWYVPIPPLPALLLMPVMLFVKPENIFMGDVSMLLGALNAVLVYLILEQLIVRRWVLISRTSHFLLVALFAFGTNHLWVSIMGEVWFVSQVITVTFLALSVLAALRGASPWLIGSFLGIAMMARPNSMMTWPFLFAIAMQIKKDDGTVIDLKQMLSWSFRSALPIGLSIVGLLSYNYIRFEDFLDFGYVSISGDPVIVNNAQRYGIFSPVYIFHNLEVMFLYFPQVQLGTPWVFKPSMEGMSIFLSTPVFVYLFRRYENRWWIFGAWASIFLGFALLVLYHNTGSAQFGYRYILDSILPLMALMSLTLQKKQPWHYYLLLLLSIMINIYGTAWFIKAG